MEEKQINEKESLEIITAMIAHTKKRYLLGDGDIMLLWGYTTLGVSLLVWSLLALTHNLAVNWLWFLIWAIGGVSTPFMVRKRIVRIPVKTYTDKIVSRLWTSVGLAGLACSVACIALYYAVGVDAWASMFVFALVIVPFAELAEGLALGEDALVWGGGFGLAIGIFATCCIIGDAICQWIMPMLIVAYVCMMIIPGHIINHKARNERT